MDAEPAALIASRDLAKVYAMGDQKLHALRGVSLDITPDDVVAIGVLLRAIATWAMGQFAGWQVSMTASSNVLAAGFSGVVGVFFGFYPARRASRLLPIQALRYESRAAGLSCAAAIIRALNRSLRG